MKLAGEEPETLDAIIITHEHSDHVNGVAVTARKLGIPVYFTEATHRAWMRWLTPRRQMTYAQWLEQCRKQAAERQAEADACTDEGEPDETDFLAESDAEGVELPRRPQRIPAEAAPETGLRCPSWLQTCPSQKKTPPGFRRSSIFRPASPSRSAILRSAPSPFPHDAADPVGFVFRAEGVRMGFATDLGYIPPNVKAQLTGRGPAAAGIEPRSGDAARRPLPLGGEAKGAFARRASIE
jgi:hypothetical protein